MDVKFVVLAPAGISLLTTESECRQPQFCTRVSYQVVEGDQPTKLCKQLLGQGGIVSADFTLLDKTARGMCDMYIVKSSQEEWWSIVAHTSGMGVSTMLYSIFVEYK